jgi:DnaJ-domain-containing protein 1
MFDDNKTPKIKLEAEILLENGDKLFARVFTLPQSRISDLLNDDRRFLPVELTDGRTTVIRKTSIIRVTPIEQDVPVYEGNDPYETLGVDSAIDYDQLRQQYVALLKGCHPDALASKDLPAPLIRFANAFTARVNQAFQRICEDRGWKHTPAEEHG